MSRTPRSSSERRRTCRSLKAPASSAPTSPVDGHVMGGTWRWSILRHAIAAPPTAIACPDQQYGWAGGPGEAAPRRRARRHGHARRVDQSALVVRGQYLFRLPRAASASGTRLFGAAAAPSGPRTENLRLSHFGLVAARSAGGGRTLSPGHDRGHHRADLPVLALRAPGVARSTRGFSGAAAGAGTARRGRAARIGNAALGVAQARRGRRRHGRVRRDTGEAGRRRA